MKQDKDLLLRYLTMALPYGVVIKITSDGGMSEVSYNMRLDAELLADWLHTEDDFKPYLRSMSSMTEEEEKRYGLLCFDVSYYDKDTPKCSYELIKWLLEKHFDFMELISRNLAIKVTKENDPYTKTEDLYGKNDKELLLKDLCARLRYGVKVTTTNPSVELGVISGISIENKISVRTKHADIVFDCTEVKPYLRPMCSMTEEEKKELQLAFNIKASVINEYGISSNEAWWVKDRKEPIGFHAIPYKSFCGVIDWLNANHFDFRNLIERGLAIDCIGLNVY